jgi:hypothetical protein
MKVMIRKIGRSEFRSDSGHLDDWSRVNEFKLYYFPIMKSRHEGRAHSNVPRRFLKFSDSDRLGQTRGLIFGGLNLIERSIGSRNPAELPLQNLIL